MLSFIKFNITNPYIEYPLVIISALLGAYVLSTIARKTFNKVFQLASESLQIDSTRFNFVKNAVTFVIYVWFTIWVCEVIPALRHMGTTLFAGAGILAAIVGFASQQAFSNIISGIFIVIFKPFRVGDSVRIGTDVSGVIEDITLRHVIIKNPENRRVVIPNSLISSQVIINSSIVDERVYSSLELTIDHHANLDVAMQIVHEEIAQHLDFLDGRSEEAIEAGKPMIYVQVFQITEIGVHIRGHFWAKDNISAIIMKTDLLKTIFDRFNSTGIDFAKMPLLSSKKTTV